MKLTVLVDNAVPVGSPLYGESGLALYLECDGKRLLFDTGASELLFHNAALPLERRPELVFHPDLFAPRAGAHNSPWPPLVPLRTVSEVFATTPVTSKLRLTKDLAFLSGIPRTSHERQRVFDRFYRALGTKTAGTGLGLAIVKRIVDIHHGTITIEDGLDGRGTCFRLTFPPLGASLPGS